MIKIKYKEQEYDLTNPHHWIKLIGGMEGDTDNKEILASFKDGVFNYYNENDSIVNGITPERVEEYIEDRDIHLKNKEYLEQVKEFGVENVAPNELGGTTINPWSQPPDFNIDDIGDLDEITDYSTITFTPIVEKQK